MGEFINGTQIHQKTAYIYGLMNIKGRTLMLRVVPSSYDGMDGSLIYCDRIREAYIHAKPCREIIIPSHLEIGVVKEEALTCRENHDQATMILTKGKEKYVT